MKFLAAVLVGSILVGVITGNLVFVVPAGIAGGILFIVGIGKAMASGEQAQRVKDVEKAKKLGASDYEAEMFASQEATRRNVQIYGH